MQRSYWILDGSVVIAFAVIGRQDHGFESGISDYVRVAAPFLVGLGVSVVALRAWRKPLERRTGLRLALGTVLVGMLARRFVWGDGTAFSFVVVTTGFVLAGMVGWRLAAAGLGRLVAGRRPSAV